MVMSTRTLACFLGSLLFVTWALQVVGLQQVGDVDWMAWAPGAIQLRPDHSFGARIQAGAARCGDYSESAPA